MNTQLDFATIKSQANFESIVVQTLDSRTMRRNGNEIRANCPFKMHEKPNGFSANIAKEFWQCFSCEEGGDLIKFIEKINQLSIKDAAVFIKEQSGNSVIVHQSTQETSYTDQEIIDTWNNASLQGNDTYFIHRSLTPPSSAKFGKNPKEFYSTMIPFQDIQGNFKGILSLKQKDKFNYYIKGNVVKFMLLGELQETGDLFIGEGIATVQTAWEAFSRKIPAIAVGSWANMRPVLYEITTTYPKLKLIILLDLDKKDKIENIRASYPHAICLLPKFQSNKMNLKDFNDIISKEHLPLTAVYEQVQDGISQARNTTIKSSVEAKSFEQASTAQEKTDQYATITDSSDLIEPNSIVDNIDYSIQTADQLIDDQNVRRMFYQGKEFIGLPQRTLPKLDEFLSGLHDFIIFAAAPNVGKTALTIQLMMDVIANNSNTCGVFVSFEMSRNIVMDRIRCYLAKVTYKKLLFGELQNDGSYYTQEEQERLDSSEEQFRLIGKNILILNSKYDGEISIDTILQKLTVLKQKSNSKQAIIIVDYLQVFPISEAEMSKLKGDLAVDRHRVTQILKLRETLGNDPLIVIAEARKPTTTEKSWAGSIADISGAARIGYSCDAGVLLNTISDDELGEKISGNKEDGEKWRELLSLNGQAILGLTIDKARDGMEKGYILLIFHFQKNRFEETTWPKIKVIISILQPKYESQQTNIKSTSNSKSAPMKNESLLTIL